MTLLDARRWDSGWGCDGFCAWGASDDALRAPRVLDHVQSAKNRLLAQYRDKPNMLAAVEVLATPIQTAEDAGQDMLASRGIEGQLSGLDGRGSFFELARQGIEDNTYRVRIAGAALAAASSGTPEALRDVLEELMQGLHGVALRERPPCVTGLQTFELLQPDGEVFAEICARAVPVGTRVILKFEVPTYLGPTVGWAFDSSGGTWAEWGEDPTSCGFWGEASDGRL